MATDLAAIITEGTATTSPIDWYAEMRNCVGDAAELANRISCMESPTSDDVSGALGRLCNVVTHLLDENKALAERVAGMNDLLACQGQINKDVVSIAVRYGIRLDALETQTKAEQ